MSILGGQKETNLRTFVKANYFQLTIIILLSLGLGVYAWSEYNRSSEAKIQAQIQKDKTDNAISSSISQDNKPTDPAVSTSDVSQQASASVSPDDSNGVSVVKEETKPKTTKPTASSTPVPTPTPAPATVPPIDPAIKIEKCKAQAKYSADQKAKSDYLAAMIKAQEAGDSETAQFYFNASIKPEHPADYDRNYQSEYISCLDS